MTFKILNKFAYQKVVTFKIGIHLRIPAFLGNVSEIALMQRNTGIADKGIYFLAVEKLGRSEDKRIYIGDIAHIKHGIHRMVSQLVRRGFQCCLFSSRDKNLCAFRNTPLRNVIAESASSACNNNISVSK